MLRSVTSLLLAKNKNLSTFNTPTIKKKESRSYSVVPKVKDDLDDIIQRLNILEDAYRQQRPHPIIHSYQQEKSDPVFLAPPLFAKDNFPTVPPASTTSYVPSLPPKLISTTATPIITDSHTGDCCHAPQQSIINKSNIIKLCTVISIVLAVIYYDDILCFIAACAIVVCILCCRDK